MSRRGTVLTDVFPDIAGAADRDLPDVDLLLDGELVVWSDGRLAFDALQSRMNRTRAAAQRLARELPAHYVAFDALHLDRNLMPLPYTDRRAALEELFAAQALGPPWTLCPSTTDRALAQRWMRDWAPAGLEGLLVKDPGSPYVPGSRRWWRKYRLRDSTEAIVGAVGGSLAHPTTVLFGRFDADGTLRFVGRSTAPDRRVRAALVERLTPGAPDHPWQGRSFSPAWGSTEKRPMLPVEPVLVAEIAVDTAFDAGRWRHPIRLLRIREDMSPTDVPAFGERDRPASG